MILDEKIARQVANDLLKIRAVRLQPHDPFTWTSGIESPIYCDNRITLSHIEIRDKLVNYLVELVTQKYERVQVIAGVATGAIAIGVLVAHKLNLPFVYIRPESKKHGRKNRIEGVLNATDKVVVVEDLISTGKSSLQALQAVRENGNTVLGMAAIFSYGFDIAIQNFENSNCKLYTLSTYDYMIKDAIRLNYISSKELATLQNWRRNPNNWKK